MGENFQLDMTTLVVARIMGLVVLSVGVTVMTLQRNRRETVLFCCALATGVLSWAAIIAAVATHISWITVLYAGFVTATVSLQGAALATLFGRRIRRTWFLLPPFVTMAIALIYRLDGINTALFGAVVLCTQLAWTCMFVVREGAPFVRGRTSTLLVIGFSVSFVSAAMRLVGEVFWPELIRDPLASGPANSLPFLASYIGTLLITLAWLSALKDRAEGALAELAFKDELTGLANRRRFHEAGRLLWVRARKEDTALTLVLLDIDHFKAVNDRWGHGEGDRVLRILGQAISELGRPGDLAARVGGEEFSLLLPGLDGRAAHGLSEYLREKLEERLRLPDGSLVRFSAGIAQAGPKDESLDMLYRRADDALYQAKASGRDCAVISAGGGARAVA